MTYMITKPYLYLMNNSTAMYKWFSLHGQGLNSSVWFSYFGYAANIV